MSTRIHRVVRILIPILIRECLGLRLDTETELIEQSDGASIEADSIRPTFTLEDGLLIHNGIAEKLADWDSVIDDLREESSRCGTF